eukprot:gene18243-18096_t
MSGVVFLIVSILALLFVLSIVVVVHELGHFWAARIVPDEHDLDSLREEVVQSEGEAALKRYFQFKPLWQRAIIVAAGPVSNFILAIALFAALAMAFGVVSVEPKVKITDPKGPAAISGIRDGDVVRRMNGATIERFDDLVNFTRTHAGTPVRIEVSRDGAPLSFTATPVLSQIDDRFGGRMKVGLLGLQTHPDARVERERLNPIAAFSFGGGQTWKVLSTTVVYLGRVITGKIPADQIGSLLGIGNTAGKVAQAGAEGHANAALSLFGAVVALLGLAAFVSISVGFMNLLPLPVLDGGHLVFYAYEAVARRPLPAHVQAVSYRLGLALLVGFMLFATWNDLQRLRLALLMGSTALMTPAVAFAQTQQGVVQRIVVIGNERIEASTIASYIPIQPGEAVDSQRIDLALKTLFRTELFADVKIDLQGGDLNVRVVENPIINKVVFEGNSSVKDDKIKEELTIRPRGIFTRAKVQSDVQRIIELYRRSGRISATVTPKVVELPQKR